jgi:DNA-binding IclR family transcriptional regulator
MSTYGRLLEELADSNAPRTVADMSHQWGLPAASIQSTIEAFVKLGIVERGGDKTWRVRGSASDAIVKAELEGWRYSQHIAR